MKQHLLSKSVALGTLAMSVVGCASATAPQTELTEAKTAISAAEARGAQKVPEASLYLKMAKDGVQQAERLMAEEEYEEAARVLERAEKDAQLAGSITHEDEVKQKAEDELERVRSLQEANARRLQTQRELG